jgi:hypothetical protein
MPDPITAAAAGTTIIGSKMQADATSDAAASQAASDAARLAEEKRVREQLRLDTQTQRSVADQAFSDYNAGLISFAEAQQKAAAAMGQVQSSIGQNQLADTAKSMEMAKFQPYSIRTGTGSTFFDQGTGQAGFALSPETSGYQQDLYRKAGEAAGNINLGTSPEQQAYQRLLYGGANMLASNLPFQGTPEQQAYQQQMAGVAGRLAGNLPFEGTPEQQQFQQSMYKKAAEQAANLNLDPAAQAQKYYQQQQDILAGSRGAEDIAARQQDLQRGRIGLGVSTEAAGAGAGGMVNPDEYVRRLAREQVNRQIAADASQRATGDIAQQLQTTQGLFGSGTSAQNQIQQSLGNQLSASGAAFGQSSGAQNQIQQALANQLAASQAMATGGTQSEAARQAIIGGQLQNASGLFGAGMRPEEFGLNALTQGVNIGNTMASQGINQANLYNTGMSNVYANMLNAANTAQTGAQYLPQAKLTGAQEDYNRQQTYLGQLQGSSLPYQAMTMPQATVPGSAYAKAALGSGLMNAGMRSIDNYLNPVPIQNTPNMSVVGSFPNYGSNPQNYPNPNSRNPV